MKLSKLLGAGKSFFGGGETVSYRPNKKVYLPKFNSEKNPFAPKADAPEKSAPAEPQKNSAPVAVSSAPKPVRAAGWGKLNPFRAPESAAAMPNVQPDLLSLDAVKVLHNDLSDAEVEFVPIRSRNVMPASGLLDETILKTA
jgi:hypothetical protein